MADKSIRIQIGASIDRDLTTVFPSLEAAAKRARATIATEMAAGFDAVGKASKAKMVSAVEKDFAELKKWATGTAVDVKTPLVRAVESIAKESRANLGEAKGQFALLGREATTQLSAIERAARRAATEQGNFGSALRKTLDAQTKISSGINWNKGFGAPGLAGAAGMMGRGALRAGRFALSQARAIGMDVARGLGIQTDLTGLMQQGIELESGATFLSNMAYQPGAAGAAGRRQSPQEIVRDVRRVANETAYDPTQILEGLRDFVGRTGDLETGRRIMKSSAVVARATGASTEDVFGAAGDISLGLGANFKGDRAKATEALLRGVAGQGKMGAMEMRSFAAQMAKIASQAGQFGAGNVEQTITTLSALAQESRQQGGSATASQAANSVKTFVASLSKGKTINAYKGFGINLRDKEGNLQKPEDIIVEALQAAGSSRFGGMAKFSQNMGKMVSEARARTLTAGFEKVYQETFSATQGTEQQKQAAATKAVVEELNRLRGAAMSLEETNESYRASMQTTQAKVQVFNNKIAETSDQLRSALLPAVEALAPKMIAAASAAAAWVDKLLGNKGAETTATEAETNLAMRDARLKRLLHAKNPSKVELGGLNVDLEATAAEQGVIQKDIARRKQLVAERENVSYRGTSALTKYNLGGIVGAYAADVFSGSKEQRDVAVQEDKRRIRDQETQMKQTNDLLRDIHRRFDGVLKVQMVGGDGQPGPGGRPKAPDNPAVRTGP